MNNQSGEVGWVGVESIKNSGSLDTATPQSHHHHHNHKIFDLLFQSSPWVRMQLLPQFSTPFDCLFFHAKVTNKKMNNNDGKRRERSHRTCSSRSRSHFMTVNTFVFHRIAACVSDHPTKKIYFFSVLYYAR